jgi:hypothetical protein
MRTTMYFLASIISLFCLAKATPEYALSGAQLRQFVHFPATEVTSDSFGEVASQWLENVRPLFKIIHRNYLLLFASALFLPFPGMLCRS